jgi:hypothetical protein
MREVMQFSSSWCKLLAAVHLHNDESSVQRTRLEVLICGVEGHVFDLTKGKTA